MFDFQVVDEEEKNASYHNAGKQLRKTDEMKGEWRVMGRLLGDLGSSPIAKHFRVTTQ